MGELSIVIPTLRMVLAIVSVFERTASSLTAAMLLWSLMERLVWRTLVASTASWLVTVLVGIAAWLVLLVVQLLLLQLAVLSAGLRVLLLLRWRRSVLLLRLVLGVRLRRRMVVVLIFCILEMRLMLLGIFKVLRVSSRKMLRRGLVPATPWFLRAITS